MGATCQAHDVSALLCSIYTASQKICNIVIVIKDFTTSESRRYATL